MTPPSPFAPRTHVMPGFLGTPAGITTISAPLSAASAPLSPSAPAVSGTKPCVLAGVGMCERSAATWRRAQRADAGESVSARARVGPARTHSDGVDDIVQAQLGDERVELEEEGEGLADTACDGGAGATERGTKVGWTSGTRRRKDGARAAMPERSRGRPRDKRSGSRQRRTERGR